MRIQSQTEPFCAYPPPETPAADAVRKADPRSVLRSGAIHPELVRRAEALIASASRSGLDLYVFEGFRDGPAQDRAYARGASRAKAGNSFHNYGLAVDIVFRDAKGRPSWSESHDWQALGRLGKEAGLHWGGDWKTFNDRAHFQLVPNGELAAVKSLYRDGGLGKVWKAY